MADSASPPAGQKHLGPRGPGLLLVILAAALSAACSGGGGGESGGAQAAGAQSFRVSGTIPIAAGNAADSDVNDPASLYVSNDTIATAQEIANPVVLGGYANAPGAGPAGRSQAAGDALDYFRVALAEGQVVRLFASEDLLSGDLDLALLTEQGAPLAVSDSRSQSEEIVASATGTFLVEVSANSGFSSYVLTVGQLAAGAGAVASGADFVAGEVIVEFDDGTTGGLAALGAEARARSVGMNHLRGERGRAQLLGCKDERTRRQTIASLGLGHLIPARPKDLALEPRARSKRETRRIAKALRRLAGVRNTSLNYIRKPTAVPADEHYGLQWHYDQINLPTAWDNLVASSTRAAEPVLVAVIDTGSTSHPDLQGQLVEGYDFIQDLLISADSDGCDADPSDPGDGLFANRSSFHGTHVIGTVVARTSLQAGGDTSGVAGTAFDARVMPLRVLGKGGGTDFDIMQALLYAAGLPNDCGVLPARPASVVNMSLGGPGNNPVLQTVIDSVRAAGLVVVAAAGNEGHSVPSYPAAYDGVLSVSAVDLSKDLAPYSNHGPSIDLAAPGGDLSADVNGDAVADGVLSTWFDEDDGEFKYSFLQGTSMAAPHVAGVIAMMRDVNDTLTPADIDAMLAAGDLTEDLGNVNHFGAGLIDAFKALSAAFEAVGGVPPANRPVLAVVPGSLNFGALTTSIDIEARNAGGDVSALVVSDVSVKTDDGGGWLAASPASVDTDQLGDWRISVNRNRSAGDGIYTGTVSFDSNENDIDIRVIMQVGGAGEEPADAGHHFVLLVNPDDNTTVRLLEVDASGGEYRYDFSAVPGGDYLIVAGTDIDNDQQLCDAGEACGRYPSRDNIEVVTISKNRRKLDFATGFATSATPAEGSSPSFSRSAPRKIER